MAYLKDRETFIEHEGEWPLTKQTPVTGANTLQFPRGTEVEIITGPNREGFLIVSVPGTGFYHWQHQKDLLQRQPKDSKLFSSLSARMAS